MTSDIFTEPFNTVYNFRVVNFYLPNMYDSLLP